MMTIRYACLPVLICLCFSGCFPKGQKPAPVSYYTLEYEAPEPGHLPLLPAAVKIYRFETAPPYQTDRMVYREAPFKMESYHYHRWQVAPGRLVSYFLVRDFRQASRFRVVLPPESIFSASHFLTGTVEEFYQEENREPWKAVLSVSITLAAEKGMNMTEEILLQKSYREEEPLERKNPTSLAGAMSRAMKRISERVVRDVYVALEGKRG